MSCCQGPRVLSVPRAHSQLCTSACFAALLRDVLGSLELWDVTKDGAQGWVIADKWCDGPKEKCRQRSQEIFLCSCIFSQYEVKNGWKQPEHWEAVKYCIQLIEN